MSETTLLRQNAIVKRASVGATPPLGPVKTGELPHVQVKPVPNAPPVREIQRQQDVSILAPNSRGAVTSGNLPVVQIKMGQNGPQEDNGGADLVVIKDNSNQTVAAGSLSMVQTKTERALPKVQTMPNVKGGPPRIVNAAPALSTPRVSQSAQGGARVTRIAAPVSTPVTAPLPVLPALTTEQWMVCQHALSKYIGDLAGTVDEAAPESEAAALAKSAIVVIDDLLVAISVRAEAAANGAVASDVEAVHEEAVDTEAPAPAATHYVAPRAVTGGYYSPASLAPQAYTSPPSGTAPASVAAPRRAGYVAQQSSVRKTHLNSGLVPRGVKRAVPAGGKLPPVIVTMDGNRAVVNNKAEIDAVRAARDAQAQAAEAANEAANDLPQG